MTNWEKYGSNELKNREYEERKTRRANKQVPKMVTWVLPYGERFSMNEDSGVRAAYDDYRQAIEF